MSHPVQLASPETYKRAIDILMAGGLVALPTETVYGLAGHALNDAAVRRIYAVKGRPAHNPLIAHVMTPDDAHIYAHVSPLAQKLIDAFWPGPLTLVLPRKDSALSAVAGADLPTLALRCPDTPWTQIFKAEGFHGPLFMPSANLSGHVSPTTAQHVHDDLGDQLQLIVDAGPCTGGVESTVVKINSDRATLLRPGGLTAEDFAPYLDKLENPEGQAVPQAPGMLASHYAPKAKVRLNATDKRMGETYLAFGSTEIEADFNLSPSGDLSEAAHHLYEALRRLDTEPVIAVAPIPETGLGLAINDRLRRAAAER